VSRPPSGCEHCYPPKNVNADRPFNPLNKAPESGYQRQYKIEGDSKDSILTYYLKSRGGQVYGHFHILELYPGYKDQEMAGVRIEFYVNPVGSRNLEFDPSKQTEYSPNASAKSLGFQ
jgi:hypothetical protein